MEKKDKPRVKILVCCHKPGKWLSDDVYMPIQCGKAISDVDLGIQGDDTGDNISAKNPNYCELTAMYWAWKNLKDVDYIGLCHYRRYFNFHQKGDLFSDFSITRSEDFDKLNLSVPDFDKIFSQYDIILSKPKYFPYSLFTDYCINHVSEDLRTVFSVIRKLYSKYIPITEKAFFKSNKLPPYNMMIMKWADFDNYCKWLFDILFETEKYISIEHYNATQKRIWGYMGERLLSVYVNHANMKRKYFPIYWINDKKIQMPLIMRMGKYYRNHLAFILQRKYDLLDKLK